MQRRGDVDHIRYSRLDAVAAALDLADDARHLVAVFRVVDGLGARYIYYLSHGSDLYRDYCCWACRTLYGLALALRFSRSGMHTKWCRMDRLRLRMAPALIAAAVWQSGLLRRRGDENAQGQIERTHRRRPKPSGDVYRRQAAFWTLAFKHRLSIKSGFKPHRGRAIAAAAAFLQLLIHRRPP